MRVSEASAAGVEDLEQRPLRVYLASLYRHVPLAETPSVCIKVSDDTPAQNSLRKAALALAEGGHGQGDPKFWVTEWFGSVHPGMMEDSSTYHDVDHATFYMSIFGVRRDGVAVLRRSLDGLTWGDIWRAASDGMYPVSVRDEVVITDDGGWGAGWEQFWLQAPAFISKEVADLVVSILGGVVTEQILQQARRVTSGRRTPRRVRHQAKLWAEQGLSQPHDLLDYLYRRPGWPVELLATRLRLDAADARALLTACAWKAVPDNPGFYVPGELRTAEDCLAAWREAQRLILSQADAEGRNTKK